MEGKIPAHVRNQALVRQPTPIYIADNLMPNKKKSLNI
jgi:hypothetical protein